MEAGEPTRPLLGEAAPNPRIDRDLMLARVEQRLLGRTLEPVRVGRFVVLRRVGQGGMGVVYAAHDPELDRKVAIKIVDDGRSSEAGTDEAHQELLREARAAAALTHPNVVTVYEVGVEGDAVFLAMEYVDGPTLRQWLEAERRNWREVVGMLVAAGRGLAAAHRAGLVHRDFKPDNVLIGDDGRPRVADFGLARLAPPERTDAGHGAARSGEGTFTAVAGTPRYMAPEQHEGHGIGPASDQFAFCVALYEALYGQHPFGGQGTLELAARVCAGELLPPGPAARRIPARVTRLVLEGLRVSPNERHPSMEVLLEGLQGALRRRGRIALAGAALALSGIASAAGYQIAPEASAPDPCADAASPMAARWSPEVRQRLRAAFVATERPGAEDTAALVADKLDRYAAQWSAMRERTCRETLEQGQRTELQMELGYACLERRLAGMATLVDELVAADAKTVARAAAAVDELVPLSPCEDRSELLLQRANSLHGHTDRSVRSRAHDELEALGQQVSEGEALRSLGQRDRALALAEAALEQAREGGLRAIEARALALRGRLRREASALDEAWDDLRSAATLGLESEMPGVTVEALVGLSGVIRARREGVEQAFVLLDLARGLARRGAAPAVYGLRVALERAKLEREQRRFEAARDELRRALSEAEAEGLPPDHTLVLSARNDLAANLVDLGELAEAERIFTELLPRRVAAQGLRHRSVGTLLINLGVVAHNQKRWEVAQGWYERALEFYDDDGRRAEQVRLRLGILWAEQERSAEAAALLSEVLEQRRQRLGPEHADVAEVLAMLAEAENDQGRHEAAIEHALQAVALLERAHGPEYFDLRAPLVTLGRAERDRGHATASEAALRRAHAIVVATEVDGIVRGEVCWELARTLGGDRSRRDEALALGREAAQLYGAAGERGAQKKASIEAWLREHGGDDRPLQAVPSVVPR